MTDSNERQDKKKKGVCTRENPHVGYTVTVSTEKGAMKEKKTFPPRYRPNPSDEKAHLCSGVSMNIETYHAGPNVSSKAVAG